MKKGTRVYSILFRKCPQCQEGDFFDGSFFKATVKKKCEHCEMNYHPEPGYYQGSYYVAYALSVAVFVTVWVSSYLFFSGMTFNTSLIIIISALILTAPVNYPLSKIIWINLFFHFKGEKEK